MLTELFIRNFAIIDELKIEFYRGFNVLTGETGAGKSIILDATALVLGERADSSMIRGGFEEAYVEATFQLSEDLEKDLTSLLESEALESEQEGIILLAREIRSNGRNICRINGRTVNLSLLKEFGDRLVDIHGQGEHLSLLKPRSHLPLLDAYAGLDDEREQFTSDVKKLRHIRQELTRLRQDEKALAQKVDLLKYQIEEIDAAGLKEDEEDALRIERGRLANAERLIENSSLAITILNGLDGEELSVNDLLGQAEKTVAQLAKLDGELSELLIRFQDLTIQLSDLTNDLLSYQDKLDYDADRLAFVEERIELINRLKRKYGDSISDILAWQGKAEIELDGITRSEERIVELTYEEEKLLRKLGLQAKELSGKRRAAAKKMSASVEEELIELQMEKARFEVSFVQRSDENGVYIDDSRLAFDESGVDDVSFSVSTNPGEELKPLAKVASGGETSRLMLALKTVLAQVDSTPTLIFDEIDQGIGGRVGDVVGRKLWRLTSPARHQVIVVTHLPQLAGYAEGHFNVSKQTIDNRTTTKVTMLEQDGRIKELAAMLGTEDEYATGGAESILLRVAESKKTVSFPDLASIQ